MENKMTKDEEIRLLKERVKELEESETEFRKQKESLNASKEIFRNLFENIKSGVAIYEAVDKGADFVFKEFNHTAERIEKIKREDVIGRKVTKVFPGVKDFGILEVFQRVWKTGKSKHHPISLYKDERIVGWRENFIFKLPSGEVVAIYEDITERKKAVEELRESEERFRLIADNSIESIYQLDMEGNLLYINNAGARMYGFEPEEMKGMNFTTLLTPEHLEEGSNYVKKVLAGENVEGELYVKHKDGRIFPIGFSMVPVMGGQEIVGFSGVSRDITERKRAGEELDRMKAELEAKVVERTNELQYKVDALDKSQEAMLFMVEDLNKTSTDLRNAQEELLIKERLAVLGQFSGSISHELRNPLGVIDSSLYFLKMKLENRDEKVKQHLDRIGVSVNNATSIIQSLLNLTRMKKPDAGMNKLVDIILSSIASSNLPVSIEVIQNFPKEEIFVKVESDQCRMAFKNIIKNAVEAMKAEGTLTVTIREDKKKRVEVSFKNTGSGISPENIEKVFQPLFSTKAKGIGFGLSITKMIIENHKGSIRVESEEGKGAEFIVSLPIYEKNK